MENRRMEGNNKQYTLKNHLPRLTISRKFGAMVRAKKNKYNFLGEIGKKIRCVQAQSSTTKA